MWKRDLTIQILFFKTGIAFDYKGMFQKSSFSCLFLIIFDSASVIFLRGKKKKKVSFFVQAVIWRYVLYLDNFRLYGESAETLSDKKD